ncbi:unnamed protein product [Ixodes persulcatus]
MDAEERLSGYRLKRTLHCVIAVLLGALLLWFFSGRQEIRDVAPPPSCPQRPAADRAAADRLLYNRVPKCGSTTLVHLLRRLAKSNGFSHVHSKTYNQRLLSPEEQAQFVRDMSAAPAPYSHDRHIYFVDFGQFGRPSPAYVNVIRDPVDRLVSSFYYRRAVATGVQGTGKPSRFWLSKVFQDCVRRGDEECTFAAGQTHRSLMMPYFCGHDVRCTTVGDPWALRTAMEHMDRHFAVVGVLEDMNATLALLERRLPAFFRGALQLYRQFAVHQNRNERRKPVPAEIREQLRHNLSTEYELYHLVRQRLYSQLRTLRQEDADARTWTRR